MIVTDAGASPSISENSGIPGCVLRFWRILTPVASGLDPDVRDAVKALRNA